MVKATSNGSPPSYKVE